MYQQDVCSCLCHRQCHSLSETSCSSRHQRSLALKGEQLLNRRHFDRVYLIFQKENFRCERVRDKSPSACEMKLEKSFAFPSIADELCPSPTRQDTTSTSLLCSFAGPQDTVGKVCPISERPRADVRVFGLVTRQRNDNDDPSIRPSWSERPKNSKKNSYGG